MNKITKFIIFSVIGILLFEVFFWNISSFRTVFGGYQSAERVDFSAVQIENGYIENGKIIGNGSNVSVIIDDIGYRIGTITLDVEREKEAFTNVRGEVSDVTYSAKTRQLFNAQIILGDKYSRASTCNFSGAVSYLKLTFEANGKPLTINEISFNKAIPMRFSLLRMFIEFCAVMLCYFLFLSKVSKETFTAKQNLCKFVTYAVCVLFIYFSALSMGTQMKNTGTTFGSQWKLTYGNQISQELVDSFEAGYVSLLTVPSEEFIALENQYDDSQREGLWYPWDHLYKNENYYSYYGIGSVLTLFLPYHLITGYYFSTYFAVFLFGSAGIIFLCLAVYEFFKKYLSFVSVSAYTMSIIMTIISSTIWVNYITPQFYEIAQISAFAALTAATYFMLSAYQKDKVSFWRLAMGMSCLGYGVMCRPTITVYCLPALVILWFGFKKFTNFTKKQKIAYFICGLAPLAVFGITQATYNYLRFENPLDFGIQYSLTIYDFTQIEFHWIFAIISIFNYLFSAPRIDIDFPFIHSNYQSFNPNGYFFIANTQAVGLIFRSAPILSFVFAKKAYNLTAKENRKPYAILFLLCSVIIPLIIMFSVWQNGYGIRYASDFVFMMLLGAFAVCFTIHKTLQPQTKKLLNVIFAASFIFSILINFSMTYEYQLNQVYGNYQLYAEFLSFENLFMIF